MRKARPAGDIVVVLGGFHGRTYGSLSATPQEAKQAPFAPLVPGFRAVAPTAEAIAAAVDERTAAVMLEVIQGESGVHALSQETLQAARAACDEHGAALVFDEVQAGMGRTGTPFRPGSPSSSTAAVRSSTAAAIASAVGPRGSCGGRDGPAWPPAASPRAMRRCDRGSRRERQTMCARRRRAELDRLVPGAGG